MGRNNKKSEKNDEVKHKRRKQGKENTDISRGVNIANKAVKKEKVKREKSKIENEKKKDNKEKRKILKYIIILFLVLVLLLLLKYRHVLGITFSRETTEKDSIVIETTMTDSKIYPYQNEILVYSKGNMLTYSRYGKNTWQYSFDETFIPTISTKGKYIQVLNKDNGYMYVFNNKYESARKKINGTIKLGSINSRGDSAIHYSKEGAKSNIGVYDKRGNEKYAITLSTDNIANVYLSDNSKYLMFYEVDTEGISVNSVLKVIDLKNNNKVETILEVKNDVIYNVVLKNSKVYALTSNKVYICNIDKKNKREYDISDKNILNISINSLGISYINKNIASEKYALNILTNMYKVVGQSELDDNVKELIYSNGLAYLINNKDIKVYNMWGMYIKKFTADNIITKAVIFNDGKNIAVNYSNKIVVIGI